MHLLKEFYFLFRSNATFVTAVLKKDMFGYPNRVLKS